MRRLFKGLYRLFVRQKFFNRLFLIYTLIILFSILSFSFIVIRDLTVSAQKDAVYYNNQMLQSVANFFGQKENTARIILKNFYANPYQYQDMLDYLSQDFDRYDQDYLRKVTLLKYYLESASSLDRDINDAVIYKKISQTVFSDSSDITVDTNDFLINNQALFDKMDDNFYGVTITPSYKQKYAYGTRMIYTIAENIRGQTLSVNFKNSIAILSLNMNTERIENAFSGLEHKYNNDILVLTKDGYVIYDSTNRYYEQEYPFFNKVKASGTSIGLDEESIVNADYNDYLGLYTVSILPKSQVDIKILAQKRVIFIFTAISILIAILLAYISIAVFSRRVRNINQAIQKVQDGDLTYRIHLPHTNDEISRIAYNFNHMCDMLINYINKVYVSEIKQKEAEIYALQSQVDPHFLYNTLEIIRMEALETQNEQVCHMVEILAQLFRNSIKGGMIVHIRDELEFCKYYLELYSIRYSGILEFDFLIDPEIHHFAIIKHLFQPLIENCVVHGIRYNRGDNRITVKGCLQDNDIIIGISDNGYGMDQEQLDRLKAELEISPVHHQHSIGIANVNQRIRLVFGENYGVRISSIKDEGTNIIMRIPARTVEEVMEHVQSAHSG